MTLKEIAFQAFAFLGAITMVASIVYAATRKPTPIQDLDYRDEI